MSELSFVTIGPLQTVSLGSVNIPTYYLVISVACCVGIYWSFLRSEKKGLSQEIALNLNAIVLIAGFFGARLLHIVYEAPSYYLQNPIQVFYFWQGGFVFLGGALSGYFAALFYIKKKKETLWNWHDVAAPVIPLAYAVGRVGCFFQGCCYGKICDLPWAMPLKQVNVQTQVINTFYRHPTTLYIVFWELLLVGFLIYIERKLKRPGHLFFLALFFHSLGRIVMEIFRDDPRGPSFEGFSISLTLSLALLVFSLLKLKMFHTETK